MNQEFVRHPIIPNYKASRDGVIRNCRLKKPVGNVTNSSYLIFNAGGKKYLCHDFVYKCYFGEIKKCFVIDHIDGNIKNNSINNLRVVSQSRNCSLGNKGRCKTITRRAVKSKNAITAEEITFHSMTAAGKYFGICLPSVRKVTEKIYISVLSKKLNQRILFSYSVLDTEDTYSVDV